MAHDASLHVSDLEPEKPESDPVFLQEQAHLSSTYHTLQAMGRALAEKMTYLIEQASGDKQSMAEELSTNLETYADAMETYADFASMNRIIDAYNIAQDITTEKLAAIELLLRQPYFAKIVIQQKAGAEPKELYIGTAGISDENCRRMVVDWRSPVAEVYYNQSNGATSYTANGRTIDVELLLRRQFDIEQNRLNAYFDTTVAIQDALLLASLSKQRTAQMQAITATIQREQNLVVRHDDVPVLLVAGIAGSGKTSVLMQRIAYLFYQNRGTLDPREVFLVTPNPVFQHYVENVLPDLGESNPETLTWNEFAAHLLPLGRGGGKCDTSPELLARIDKACEHFAFDADDFKDIVYAGVRLLAANQVRQVADKFKHIPAGPHLVALMREELTHRLENRLAQMAASEDVHDELYALNLEEQVRIFHETIEPQTEQEERALALQYLQDRFAGAFAVVERDEWLRIDRIGARLLGTKTLEPTAWLYLKMAVTGMSNPQAKYVMIDEVQDYTTAQLAVLARYFRRAHFLLLGDENQAIKEGTASFDEVRALFGRMRGEVAECQLMTSYRSTPEITALFAALLPAEARGHVSAVQRDDTPPEIACFSNEDAHLAALKRAVEDAAGEDGLTAVVVPWKHYAKKLQTRWGEGAPRLLTDRDELPESGVVLITLPLAKGLEFDHVIIPDASAQVFPADEISRRRLYTTISRATRRISIFAQGELTSLLR